MLNNYSDIIRLTVEDPVWYDGNGVPRYKPHGAEFFPVYAKEVALIKIACQACLRQFLVQMSCNSSDYSDWFWRQEWPKPDTNHIPKLADTARDGIIHYGDPPGHHGPDGEYCHTGCTMNVYDLAVVEFWEQGQGPSDWRSWKRISELERELPDASEIY